MTIALFAALAVAVFYLVVVPIVRFGIAGALSR